nr:relaxase/mobilization nuclease domain-containing protein [Pedobacter insulae]
MAGNYPVGLEDLNEKQRLNMLLKTVALNPDVKRNSIHISLNFAPGEQLSDEKLREISGEYMQQIGFGNQPYLVYRHDDAAHPHIHIATVRIRPDGTNIDTFNIGRNRSEPARKTIENKYGLVKAEEQKKQAFSLEPVNASKVVYGEKPTRKAISNVLQAVLSGYKYTSLPELNAVLNQYNIAADRGNETSRIFRHHGLVYHVLDADGKPVGVPVKASAFYNNPGMKFLEKKYLANDVARQSHKARVKNTVDLLLLRNPKMNLDQLVLKLKNEGIHLTIRQNADGIIYGLTYVDHRTKCVFNGSNIGKGYSAKGLLEKLQGISLKPEDRKLKTINPPEKEEKSVPFISTNPDTAIGGNDNEKGIIESIMGHENSSQNVPFDWKRKKKKKKRR